MFEFKHPKYYKELRDAGNELAKRNAVKEDLACSGSSPARNKSDQAISLEDSTESVCGVRPGPGLKLQAASHQHQASSDKLSNQPQASSAKRQASQPE
jgi:hypothetical protein